MQREYDGPLLWDFIRRRVNPSTSVRASKLKERLEKAKLEDFDHDVIRYNSWFDDMRGEITKEEGEGYSEYLRTMFRTYLTSNNQSFLESINAEERDWMQGKVRPGYGYRDLMNLGRLTYNNLVNKGDWKATKETTQDDPANKYLALATEIIRTLGTPNGTRNGQGGAGEGGNQQGWRFSNPENLQQKKIGGRVMKWCSSDCHRKPQWCGRRNCLNNADYEEAVKKRKEKRSTKDTTTIHNPKDFRMALAALTTKEDFDPLEKQFFSVKE